MRDSSTSAIRISAVDFASCRADLLALRNATRATARDDAYFTWRYLERPGGYTPIVVMAECQNGQKIGALSLIPHDFVIDNAVCPLGIVGDISVKREWRGNNVTARMLQCLSGLEGFKQLKAGIVLPNESAARPLRQSGWQSVSELRRHVRIIRVDRQLGRWIKPSWLLRALSWPINAAAGVSPLHAYSRRSPGLRAEPIDSFDDRFDQFWDAFPKEGIALGVRNRRYLTWRYTRHPVVRYKIFTLSQGDTLRGYLVFHVDDDRCVIDDLLCLKGASDAVVLLSSFLNHVRLNESAASVSISVNHSRATPFRLPAFGFLRRSDHQALMIFQNDAATHSPVPTTWSQWYVTGGDKDV